MKRPAEGVCVGWREWVALPDLGVPALKAKVDTGARTSALHAENIELLPNQRVRFVVAPGKNTPTCLCEAALVDQRSVTNSGGEREIRCVIETRIGLANLVWPIEMTLTRRDDMKFRMLLGRTAMQGRIAVDPGASYLWGRKGRSQ